MSTSNRNINNTLLNLAFSDHLFNGICICKCYIIENIESETLTQKLCNVFQIDKATFIVIFKKICIGFIRLK